MLGRLYEVIKDVSNAESNYKKAIELNPNIAGFHNSLANFYVSQNLTDKAIEGYNAAIQKAPDSISALMGLAILYDAQKKYDKAKEYYQKVLKINPRFAPAANNLAYLYAEKGENIDEALALAQSAKEQFPDDPHISDTLGWVYYKKNIFTRAITYLKEANEKISDNPLMRYHLGMAYFKNGDKGNAKAELRKALELNPRFPGAEEAKDTLTQIK
jgi:tetratricopeptide (TPR) repeat protein